MNDKSLIASYVAGEVERINEKLKKMVQSETPPTDAERDEVIQDIETTLNRLQNALSNLKPGESDEEEDHDQRPQ